MLRGWIEADIVHGSAVMLPSGEMFRRVLDEHTDGTATLKLSIWRKEDCRSQF